MATIDTKTCHTPQDLLEMPDGNQYELVNGELVERNVGLKAGLVSAKAIRHLEAYCSEKGIGWVFAGDASYQCFPDAPDKVRRPDVSFIRTERLPGGELPEGHARIAPDLVVEVISPNDRAYDIDHKVEEYCSAGVRLVWVISPAARSVRVHRADGSVDWRREQDELSGEDVLPGFSCAVRDLFPPPTPAHQPNARGGTRR